MTLIPPGQDNPASIRFRDTLRTLESGRATLEGMIVYRNTKGDCDCLQKALAEFNTEIAKTKELIKQAEGRV